MSTQTLNYGLVKPELNDPADITTLNANWDKIDETLSSNKTLIDDVSDELNEFKSTTESNNKSMVQNFNSELLKLQPKITYGTSEPSGGKSGDVYIQLLEG